MSSKQFIENLNKSITIEGQNIMNEFFITFSRFEFALKSSNYVNTDNGKVMANWGTFTQSISNSFNIEKTQILKKSIEYLLEHPAKLQIIHNGQLGWENRVFQANEPLINKLSLTIRDIRNNLFHGGKFNGNYEQDVSRNFLLLKYSIIVLNEWLNLNVNVKENFSKSI